MPSFLPRSTRAVSLSRKFADLGAVLVCTHPDCHELENACSFAVGCRICSPKRCSAQSSAIRPLPSAKVGHSGWGNWVLRHC